LTACSNCSAGAERSKGRKGEEKKPCPRPWKRAFRVRKARPRSSSGFCPAQSGAAPCLPRGTLQRVLAYSRQTPRVSFVHPCNQERGGGASPRRTAEGGCPYASTIPLRVLRTKEKGEIRSPPRSDQIVAFSYCCSSSSTVSPACTSSRAKTIMADDAVGVTFRTTTSPTARSGRSRT